MSSSAPDLKTQLELLARECRTHGFTEQSDRVAQRARDLDAPLLVMIVGDGKFGKSTLINALCGREIAPVGRIPKTWKVDLYEACEEGREEAWLYWRSEPDAPQRVSVDEARRISDQQEALAGGPDGGKSDLYQVRWRMQLSWPPPAVCLVDTPGFIQDKNSETHGVYLYGGHGIQLDLSDGFEDHFSRADVVLWCIKATALQAQNLLDRLEQVAGRKKCILGVLTHIDQVEEERWPEIQAKAAELCQGRIQEFIPLAAGARNTHRALRESTVSRLQAVITQRFLTGTAKLKEEAVADYLHEEQQLFGDAVGRIMSCYRHNAAQRARILAELQQGVEAALGGARECIQADISTAVEAAVEKLGYLYDAAEGDETRFNVRVREQAFDLVELQERVLAQFEIGQKRAAAHCELLLGQASWVGVALSAHHTVEHDFGLLDAAVKSPDLTGSHAGDTRISFADAAVAGVLTGAGTGAAAAALGALALGPIGLIAGAIGFFVAGLQRRSKALESAERQITQCGEQLGAVLTEALEAAQLQLISFVNETVDRSFKAHHGKDVLAALEHALAADRSFNLLGFSPTAEKRVSLALEPPNGRVPHSWYYHSLLEYEPNAGAAWAEVVRKRCADLAGELWKQHAAVKLLREQREQELLASLERAQYDPQRWVVLTEEERITLLPEDPRRLPTLTEPVWAYLLELSEADGTPAFPEFTRCYLRERNSLLEQFREIEQRVVEKWNCQIREEIDRLVTAAADQAAEWVRCWHLQVEAQIDRRVLDVPFPAWRDTPHLPASLEMSLVDGPLLTRAQKVMLASLRWADGKSAVASAEESIGKRLPPLRRELDRKEAQLVDRWDQAILNEWREGLAVAFADALEDAGSALGRDAIRRQCQEQALRLHKNYRARMVNSDWTQAASGIKLGGPQEIMTTGLAEFAKDSLPAFESLWERAFRPELARLRPVKLDVNSELRKLYEKQAAALLAPAEITRDLPQRKIVFDRGLTGYSVAALALLVAGTAVAVGTTSAASGVIGFGFLFGLLGLAALIGTAWQGRAAFRRLDGDLDGLSREMMEKFERSLLEQLLRLQDGLLGTELKGNAE